MTVEHYPLSNPSSKERWWAPIVHFLTHTVVGTAIFIVVAVPAILLHLLMHTLQAAGIGGYTIAVLTLLEYFIVSLDAVGLAIYLVVSLWKAVKEWTGDLI